MGAMLDRAGSDAVEWLDAAEADLSAVPTERLEAELMSLAGHLAAAECQFLLRVAEFDRREGWADWECLSTAHWLNWRCGVGMTAAREQVRVARRLAELPVVRAEFAAGRLSYSKVRAITRVATPEIEQGLVRMAQSATAAQMEQACRALRRTQDLAAAEEELAGAEASARERRSMSWSHRDDGMVAFRILLPAEDAELLIRAVTEATEPAPAGRTEGDGIDERRADAIIEVAAARLAPSDRPDAAPGVPELVVHVDASAAAELARRAGRPGQRSAEPEDLDPVPWPVTTSGGAHLSFAALERLMCECGSRMVARSPDGSELDAAPHRRLPSPAMRRALLARDRHCRFPGCDRRSRLRAHHIVWWSRNGPTVMENLLMLCPKHHRAVHEGGWSLTGTAREHTFRRPDGTPVPTEAPRLSGSLADLVALHRQHGRDIALDGAGGRWHGDHIDWDCFFAAFANEPGDRADLSSGRALPRKDPAGSPRAPRPPTPQRRTAGPWSRHGPSS